MASIQPHKSKSWSREDVLVLLSYMNYYVTEIREMLDRDREDGIAAAIELLRAKVGGDCSSARVKGKIASLWDSYGSDSSKSADDIYRHGAYTRTLPLLDWGYPGMLRDIASRVKMMQNHESSKDQDSNNLRRSKRSTNASRDNDPLLCRCGYTHDDLCLSCANCRSWQHGYCFYNSDAITELPGDHLCDECRADTDSPELDAEGEDGDLSATLSRLQVNDRETEEQHMKRRKYGALSLFAEPANVLWGPTNREIAELFQTLVFRIRNVANSILPPNSNFKIVPWNALAESNALNSLFKTCLGTEYKDHLRPDPPLIDIFEALIGVAVTGWSFYPRPGEKQSMDSLLCKSYQELILSRGKYFIRTASAYQLTSIDGFETLKGLHRTAWSHLIDDCPDHVDSAMSKEAEVLAARLLAALAPLAGRDKDAKFSYAIEEWIEDNEYGKERSDLVERLFRTCLKLKADLPMTDKCYEVFFPAVGLDYDAGLMTTEIGDPKNADVLKGLKVELVFMPAIIEFAADAKGGGTGELVDLFGSHNFIKTSANDRRKGRTICRAIVKLT